MRHVNARDVSPSASLLPETGSPLAATVNRRPKTMAGLQQSARGDGRSDCEECAVVAEQAERPSLSVRERLRTARMRPRSPGIATTMRQCESTRDDGRRGLIGKRAPALTDSRFDAMHAQRTGSTVAAGFTNARRRCADGVARAADRCENLWSIVEDRPMVATANRDRRLTGGPKHSNPCATRQEAQNGISSSSKLSAGGGLRAPPPPPPPDGRS